ncbi:hypothetical protein ABOC32_29050 (plasmid) [Pseudomonas sp. WOUb67]|uniref:hypothetical protein n=1 Tax=Pseudomonas sp. WOUb67 TaxID=3161136 RepID=UPI003CEF02DD
MKTTQAKALRAASLLSIMLGAFIFGAGANPLASFSFPPFIVAFAAVCVGAFGLLRGGLIGMLIFAIGNALVGSLMLGGMIPHWLFALGVLVAMPGIAYRIFCPE